MSSMDSSVDGTVPQRSSGSTASSSTQSEGVPSAVGDELYAYTMSIVDTKEIEAVWLSHSYPSPISLKLRDIQETVKANGCVDADTLNFAIRKLVRENHECFGSKHYVINTDFATHAISEYEEDEYSSLESCIDDEFVDHHNNAGLNQDLNRSPSHPNSEVLCIPVFHGGHWSLYAFSMKDRRVSILDPKQKCKCHEDIRPKICKALEFVKFKFNIFQNKSNNFSSWGHEVVKECSQTNNNRLCCRDDDSGFLVFEHMRLWGQLPPNPAGSIPTADSTEMRKQFLAYVLSFKDNEAYQLPSRASQLIQNLPGGPAPWTRCEMDSRLHKALTEDNKDEFTKLFPRIDDPPIIEAQEKLLRGATCDGDGMLHIAVRHGKLEVLNAMKGLFVPSAGANSRVLIKYHLRLSGSDHGTYRRDLLKGEDKARGELDQDKLSESISKSAGLTAVCAIFMLNISVATFYNVAKQNLSADAVALPPPPPPPLISRARGRAFRALIVSDALTFASSSLSAFCSIFAGFSTMDRPTRLVHLAIAGFSLRIACLAVVAVFVLAAYLAFAPIDPHIAAAAFIVTVATVIGVIAIICGIIAAIVFAIIHFVTD
ncbi:hypothetical protein Zm00014a_024403 [Zea mays]|uniref:Ubiquitin-like protease family profile domain-containing protein n=1 Tax=Zea mays TaxID=4577 RepID=A0A3L6EB49_MAIZE|nr:hypothetical protein Zm00014a_024403 [Zea mays]